MHITNKLQVKDIIKYLEMVNYVAIEQLDVYLAGTPNENESEEIYRGSVIDIPWYIMDYYIANTDCGAISTFNMDFDDGRKTAPALYITVVEDKERLDPEYN